MEKDQVWVVGHRNPDTDSICAAIAYARLKNQLSPASGAQSRTEYLPKRAGAVNAETAYVLRRFGVPEPELITDVGTQIKDIQIRKTEGISSHISMRQAWERMKGQKVVTLPVVSERNQLEGLIVSGDIAESYMNVNGSNVLAVARTQYKNIVETLDGVLLTGNGHAYFVRGKVVIADGSPERLARELDEDDLVLVGDREDELLLSVAEKCSCMVVTGGCEVSAELIRAAKRQEVVVIGTEYDMFTAARLINQSVPVRYFMTKKDIVHFHMDDYVDEVRAAMSQVRHRDFPILDDNQNYVGMFSRRNLMNMQKKRLILVDHNERSQAVSNVGEAEILEIIDHHRLGSMETVAPVFFRNQPLGCTSTIIYQMYREQGIPIEANIAGLMCAAILSDTLMFRSPTCTAVDREAALALAEIAGVQAEELAQSMFEAGSDFSGKTEDEILNQDFKTFCSGEISFGVSQVLAMGRRELERVHKRLEPRLEGMLAARGLDMLFVMLTDILTESTFLIYAGEESARLAAAAWQVPQSEQGVLLEHVVSRKKQLVPALMNALSESN